MAEDLKYTANINKKLVEHYYAYPDRPEMFVEWQKKLVLMLREAFEKFRWIN